MFYYCYWRRRTDRGWRHVLGEEGGCREGDGVSSLSCGLVCQGGAHTRQLMEHNQSTKTQRTSRSREHTSSRLESRESRERPDRRLDHGITRDVILDPAYRQRHAGSEEVVAWLLRRRDSALSISITLSRDLQCCGGAPPAALGTGHRLGTPNAGMGNAKKREESLSKRRRAP